MNIGSGAFRVQFGFHGVWLPVPGCLTRQQQNDDENRQRRGDRHSV